MNAKPQALYGLKFNPFRPDVPVEALYTTPQVDAFLRRVELGIADGPHLAVLVVEGLPAEAAVFRPC